MALTCSSVPPPGTCEKMRKQLVTRRLAAVKARAGKIALPCGSRQDQKDPVMNCHVFLAPSGPSPRRWHSGSSRRWLRQVHAREIRRDMDEVLPGVAHPWPSSALLLLGHVVAFALCASTYCRGVVGAGNLDGRSCASKSPSRSCYQEPV